MRVRPLWLLVTIVAGCSESGSDSAAPTDRPALAELDPQQGYAGSERCAPCHAEHFERWRSSHHAQAERPVDLELDTVAFEGKPAIEHGSTTSHVQHRDGRFEITTANGSGDEQTFVAQRVIGVEPLRQYLVETPGGRWQALSLAYDPAGDEWFDIFGEEDRRPGEWGHWTGRGMNWNSQCADCHQTNFVKGYDDEHDRYDSSWAELGVGCEACHGPLEAHAAWYESDPDGLPPAEARPFPLGEDLALEVDLCGSCHSRRSELLERHLPGQSLLDAFLPELPGMSETFWPDGRVRDEDYEYAPFLLSRLHAGGISCKSCHDPHTARTLFEGDALCMSCHAEPVNEVLAPIDPVAHSHHEAGSPGASCIACHMPVTTYMQRDPRHDHSFSTPDPALSAELGTPDVCTECHADRDLEWAAARADEWWGELLERPRRERARIVAAARRWDARVVPKLLRWSREEPIAAWRAVAAGLLGELAAVVDPDRTYDEGELHEVDARLLELTRDEHGLVRTFAARALEAGPPDTWERVRELREDPIRSVRVSASLALGGTVQPDSPARFDLQGWLDHTADQPAGLLTRAALDMHRGQARTAMARLEQAIQWDANSAGIHHTLAVAAAQANLGDRARVAMERACELAPQDPEMWRALALARNETGDPQGAEAAFLEALRLEPAFARVWKDLALLRAYTLENPEGAEEAAVRAVELAPGSVEAWKAWIHVAQSIDADKARWVGEQAAAACPDEPSFRRWVQDQRK